jgi:hypothetical protein
MSFGSVYVSPDFSPSYHVYNYSTVHLSHTVSITYS